MKYKIKIENPCEEDWNKMTPVEGGKFCLRCSKNVIDFTNSSDTEIFRIMKNASGQICGRLREDQHDRVLIIEQPKTSKKFTFSNIAASLLLIGMSDHANAHTLKSLPSVNVAEFPRSMDKKVSNTDSELFTLKGKVLVAKTKEVLAFANVVIENTAIGTSTNELGDFELHIPACYKGSKLNIIVSYTGYVNTAFEITAQEALTKREILMEVSNTQLSEIVVATKSVSHEKRSMGGGMISYVEGDTLDSKRKSFFKRIPFFNRQWWQFWKKRKTSI